MIIIIPYFHKIPLIELYYIFRLVLQYKKPDPLEPYTRFYNFMEPETTEFKTIKAQAHPDSVYS